MSRLNTFLLGVVAGIAMDNSSTVALVASAAVGAAAAIHPKTRDYVMDLGRKAHEKVDSAMQWYGSEEEMEVVD